MKTLCNRVLNFILFVILYDYKLDKILSNIVVFIEIFIYTMIYSVMSSSLISICLLFPFSSLNNILWILAKSLSSYQSLDPRGTWTALYCTFHPLIIFIFYHYYTSYKGLFKICTLLKFFSRLICSKRTEVFLFSL